MEAHNGFNVLAKNVSSLHGRAGISVNRRIFSYFFFFFTLYFLFLLQNEAKLRKFVKKKIILTSKRNAKQPLAGQNIQNTLFKLSLRLLQCVKVKF